MARTLTKKEQGFVRDIVKGKTGTQSALDNYDTKDYSTAGAIASENLKKPKIIKAIKSIADTIPDSLLTKKHLQLLNKKESILAGGELIEIGIDTQAVSKGLDMAYKIKGLYAPEEKNITFKGAMLVGIQDATKDILNG